MIWRVSSGLGFPILVPVNYSQEIINQCERTASLIPGAKVEEGTVEGPPAVLAACLEVAGQRNVEELYRQSWDSARVGRYRGDGPINWMPQYQADAARFIAERAGDGVMVNDDLGLGKTFETIAGLYLLGRDPLNGFNGLPFDAFKNSVKVVLCPAGLKRQWASEIQKWHDLNTRAKYGNAGGEQLREHHQPKIHIVYPASDKRSKTPCPKDVEWIIGYYLDADKIIDMLKSRSYYLTIDEVHNLTGYNTKRMEQVKMLRTFALGCVSLTASDMPNKPDGLYRILDLTSPRHWGTASQWAMRYASGRLDEFKRLHWGELSNQGELFMRRSFYRFRRIKADVADQLPFDTQFQTIWLEPPNGNLKSLTQMAMVGRVTKEYLEQLNEFKLPAVREQINADIEAGIPGLTFTWTRRQADLLGFEIVGSMVVHGEDGRKDRLDEIYKYVEKCKAIGVTPQVIATYDSIGTGGNLQMFKVVNAAALHHTPEIMRQAFGRSARMGQVGTVVVRLFVAKYTTDEHLLKIGLTKLKEQGKLDGRAEPDKAGLTDALTGTSAKDFLASVLAKYAAMEEGEE